MDIGNENLRAAKVSMRAESKRALGQLDPDERLRLSRMLCDRVVSLPAWTQSSGVLVFHAMADEVDTSPIISAAVRDGKQVYLPRITGDDMRFHLLSAVDLEQHAYGMMEPPADASAWTGLVDSTTTAPTALVVCPGLAFDGAGGRLGRGRGFYDRFLAAIRESRRKIVVIGICFEIRLVAEVPAGPHDERVDCVVTELRTVGPH